MDGSSERTKPVGALALTAAGLLVAAAALSGCGGGGGGSGAVAQATRVITGAIHVPTSLGAVNVESVTLSEVVANQGVAAQPLATGTYDAAARTYRVENVPAGKLLVVQVKAKQAGGGMMGRLAAAVGSMVGRGRQQQVITVDIIGAATIGAEAVATLVKGGADPTKVTAQNVANLEAAGAQLEASTDFTSDASIGQAAQQALAATNNGATAPAVSVAVSPETASVQAGGTATFTATISGSTNTGVTWSVQEGAAGGTIANGAYTAPAAAGTYHVVAASVSDPGKSDTATVTVTAAPPADVSIAISPTTATVVAAQSLIFTATVTGSTNAGVTWSVQEGDAGGNVNGGVYTAPGAPGTYHVVAASAADPTKSATATVTVTAAAPVVSVSISPATATVGAGGTATFQAAVTNAQDTSVTWSVQEGDGGGTISAGVYIAPGTRGTYHVVATSKADPTKSATATVTVQAGSIQATVQ